MNRKLLGVGAGNADFHFHLFTSEYFSLSIKQMKLPGPISCSAAVALILLKSVGGRYTVQLHVFRNSLFSSCFGFFINISNSFSIRAEVEVLLFKAASLTLYTKFGSKLRVICTRLEVIIRLSPCTDSTLLSSTFLMLLICQAPSCDTHSIEHTASLHLLVHYPSIYDIIAILDFA